MGSLQNLSRLANSCLAKKAEIPMSPLLHMTLAAKSKITASPGSFRVTKYASANYNLRYLQEAIDYLTCKAKLKSKFTASEKEYLKEIYEALWLGGKAKGYHEAAQLAYYYVHGNGNTKMNPLVISANVYKTSKIVIATMDAMKKYISELAIKNISIAHIRSSDRSFWNKPYAKILRRMNYKTEGKMKSGGVLEAAQNNHRLHKTDGHFYLQALSIKTTSGTINTTWRVDSLYDFEPFSKHNYYTNIPLGSKKLKLPDGLSEYMTKIGVAKAFWYRAQWKENWQP